MANASSVILVGLVMTLRIRAGPALEHSPKLRNSAAKLQAYSRKGLRLNRRPRKMPQQQQLRARARARLLKPKQSQSLSRAAKIRSRSCVGATGIERSSATVLTARTANIVMTSASSSLKMGSTFGSAVRKEMGKAGERLADRMMSLLKMTMDGEKRLPTKGRLRSYLRESYLKESARGPLKSRSRSNGKPLTSVPSLWPVAVAVQQQCLQDSVIR